MSPERLVNEYLCIIIIIFSLGGFLIDYLGSTLFPKRKLITAPALR